MRRRRKRPTMCCSGFKWKYFFAIVAGFFLSRALRIMILTPNAPKFVPLETTTAPLLPTAAPTTPSTPPTPPPPTAPPRRKLLIVTYQRSGSSFLGRLFSLDDWDFYTFEPLDSLYSAMYGTPEGWNVPTDIMNDNKGQPREIPAVEKRAIAKFLGDYFTCDFDEMSPRFLFRKFWRQFEGDQPALEPYITCLGKRKLIDTMQHCMHLVAKKCPRRFGMDQRLQSQCLEAFWDSNTDTESVWRRNDDVTYGEYFRCLDDAQRRGDACVTLLSDMCKNSTLTSTKTVRMTMESVEAVLEKVPDLKVIHLIRDPRAVAVSRLHFYSSAWGMYTRRDVVREARVLCADLLSEVTQRRRLEARHPGVFKEIIYDDFVQNPTKSIRETYRFLGAELSEHVESWVVQNTVQVKNATAIASRWRSQLNQKQLTEINAWCRDFFKAMNGSWS